MALLIYVVYTLVQAMSESTIFELKYQLLRYFHAMAHESIFVSSGCRILHTLGFNR